jgi:hypothetical protein
VPSVVAKCKSLVELPMRRSRSRMGSGRQSSWRSGLIRVLAMGLVLASAAYSQAPFTPPKGDPEVFRRYLLQTHQTLLDSIQGSPGSAQQRTAAVMRVSVSDLAALERAYQDVTTSIGAVDTEARAYVDETVKTSAKPDPKKLQSYYAHRLQILHDADQRLRGSLGETAWLGMWGYIDGEFRSHVRRRVYQWQDHK